MRYFDRTKETSTTTGTGSLTLLGAVSQFNSFSTGFANNELFGYVVEGQSGTEWETGIGYLSSSTVLVRSIVKNSSNAGALVSFSAGTKNVFNDLIASEVLDMNSSYTQQFLLMGA